MRLTRNLFLCIVIAWFLSGCETYKNLPYFADLPDSARVSFVNTPYKQLLIAPDDILGVEIKTLDPSSTAIFNTNVSSPLASGSNLPNSLSGNSSSGLSQTSSNYLVDRTGIIDLPLLGKIKVQGLTTDQARDSIIATASYYYKSPSVNVRFVNLKVNVLGEVGRPGTYILPNEKNTIFDALSLAGDLTVFGRRENALLIRDSLGHSSLIRFSLNSKNLMNEPFFYLKQNDVIYIEPNKAKLASLDAAKNRTYVIAGTIVSILLVLATRIK